ncbi:MAG TPA: hypothetical protein VIL85_28100 [Thermomicrobiales bacterium]
MAILERGGIRLRAEITVADLLHAFPREDYEAEPFIRLLTVIGGEMEELGDSATGRVYGSMSGNIWHLDTECIEDHGDYVIIAERLSELAQGDLPLEAIRDYVDVGEGLASVSFRLDGREYRWDAAVEDDWVDPTILSKFAELLATRDATRRFTYFDLGGQDCLIGCSTTAELATLQSGTGLLFTWLS